MIVRELYVSAAVQATKVECQQAKDDLSFTFPLPQDCLLPNDVFGVHLLTPDDLSFSSSNLLPSARPSRTSCKL